MARPITPRDDYTHDVEHVARLRRALDLDDTRPDLARWLCDQLVLLLLTPVDQSDTVEQIIRNDFFTKFGRQTSKPPKAKPRGRNGVEKNDPRK